MSWLFCKFPASPLTNPAYRGTHALTIFDIEFGGDSAHEIEFVNAVGLQEGAELVVNNNKKGL